MRKLQIKVKKKNTPPPAVSPFRLYHHFPVTSPFTYSLISMLVCTFLVPHSRTLHKITSWCWDKDGEKGKWEHRVVASFHQLRIRIANPGSTSAAEFFCCLLLHVSWVNQGPPRPTSACFLVKLHRDGNWSCFTFISQTFTSSISGVAFLFTVIFTGSSPILCQHVYYEK